MPENRYYPNISVIDILQWEPGEADAVFESFPAGEEKDQLAIELLWLRGDSVDVKELYRDVINNRDKKTWIAAMNAILYQAMDAKDDKMFWFAMDEMESFKGNQDKEGEIFAILELSRQLILAVLYGADAPMEMQLYPALSKGARKWLSLQNSYYYQRMGNYERSIGILETTILNCCNEDAYTPKDITLYLACSYDYFNIGDYEYMERYLNKALEMGLKDRFIRPFADYIPKYGDMLTKKINNYDHSLYLKCIGLCNE